MSAGAVPYVECSTCGGSKQDPKVTTYSWPCPSCCAQQIVKPTVALSAGLAQQIAKAYGYLWHVNNEPGAPQQYSPDQAAYMARRILRDLLTSEQRGDGINEARYEIAGCKVAPVGWRCTRESGHKGPCAAIEVKP